MLIHISDTSAQEKVFYTRRLVYIPLRVLDVSHIHRNS